MGNYRFHTPDGVCDVLPSDCAEKRLMESKVRALFKSNGYFEVETPGIEYYDVYESGEFVAAEDMYKFMDQAGRILALRYDGTVPVARLAATLGKDEKPPLRYSYVENMYRFRESGGGKQREFSQAGVELLGVDSASADAEVIRLAIESAREAGIEDLQVSIGQVEFFRGLTEEWGISADVAAKLANAIDQKDVVLMDRIATTEGLSAEAKEILSMMPKLFGTYDTIKTFATRVHNETSKKALENLTMILDILEDYELLQYVSIDLGMVRGLDYYTGMIFKGFTYELGFPILSGGRYNKVVSHFGRDLSAVGFSLGISLALTALRRQGKRTSTVAIDAVVGYENEAGMRKAAFAAAKSLRETGLSVIVDTEGLSEDALEAFADEHEIGQVVYLTNNK
ncbi:MAG TPA: ATP phosphoribosyltransferase regulatory subunit [Bacillota bacterium]|nr:ATP phosphoribosyltransferase regulatory subunit [Bacillota bacterium]